MRALALAVLAVGLLACGNSGGGGTGGGTGGAGGAGGGAGAGGASGGGAGGSGGATADAGMVHVPAGAFQMGSASGDADEAPAHMVTLSAFDIDTTEVTQGAYAECVTASACTAPSSAYEPTTRAAWPVVSVSWAQAQAYCAFRAKRLPTEAEWEKAARGTDGRSYPWGNGAATCALANTQGCSDAGAEPVGMHPGGASPYGALDLAGNVWEWTADWYSATWYASAPSIDPQGPDAGTYRAYRGGSAGNDATLARSSNRASTYSPAVGGSGLGFRCVR
ncbi:MAG: SUMF1/EgtB/PvdO family nonheme iron enzyme [Archangiaceae bacterium]|nr:SUMF1/EgtB/PvdO family nonheme iron enzyme [Archangiaceae bacterium]